MLSFAINENGHWPVVHELDVHHRPEFAEQRVGIVRAGRSLRMILHAKDRFGSVAKAFHRLVVQVDTRNHDFRWQRSGVHRKAMVLRSDFHAARLQVFDRLVAAPMTEFQFEGFSAKGLA